MAFLFNLLRPNLIIVRMVIFKMLIFKSGSFFLPFGYQFFILNIFLFRYFIILHFLVSLLFALHLSQDLGLPIKLFFLSFGQIIPALILLQIFIEAVFEWVGLNKRFGKVAVKQKLIDLPCLVNSLLSSPLFLFSIFLFFLNKGMITCQKNLNC